MWWYLWTGAAGALLIVLLYRRHAAENLCGKVVVITGGDCGDGLVISRKLAARGARVIISGENHSRGSAFAECLKAETGADVQYRYLDLASLHSIREFTSDLQASERQVDILVNNASVTQRDNSITEDNIVVEMQINYFGPYLLTNLLLPLLQKARQARIINSSSVMHYLGSIKVDTIADKARDKHAHKRLFAKSKLCNILFTRALSRRLAGTNISVNCFHPGVCSNDATLNKAYQNYMFGQNQPVETITAVWLATSPTLAAVSGKYYVDCQDTKPSNVALDDALAEKLWITSAKLVKLNEHL